MRNAFDDNLVGGMVTFFFFFLGGILYSVVLTPFCTFVPVDGSTPTVILHLLDVLVVTRECQDDVSRRLKPACPVYTWDSVSQTLHHVCGEAGTSGNALQLFNLGVACCEDDFAYAMLTSGTSLQMRTLVV